MINITFIVGIERFNAGAWQEVERRLSDEGVQVRLRRFHDAHVDRNDPELIAAIAESDVVFMSLINLRSQADWLARELAGSKATAVFAYESMPEVMALTRVLEHRFKEKKGEAPKVVKVLMKLVTAQAAELALQGVERDAHAPLELLDVEGGGGRHRQTSHRAGEPGGGRSLPPMPASRDGARRGRAGPGSRVLVSRP